MRDLERFEIEPDICACGGGSINVMPDSGFGDWCRAEDVSELEEENRRYRRALEEIAGNPCPIECERRQERGRPCDCDPGVARAVLKGEQ